MTLYRGMDIGTASRAFANRRCRTICSTCSTLARSNRRLVARCWPPWPKSRPAAAPFIGGTGLYLKSLLCGCSKDPAQEDVRTRLEAGAETADETTLIDRLRQVDPDRPADCTPTTYGASCGRQSGSIRPPHQPLANTVATRQPRNRGRQSSGSIRPSIFRRINRRVDAMLARLARRSRPTASSTAQCHCPPGSGLSRALLASGRPAVTRPGQGANPGAHAPVRQAATYLVSPFALLSAGDRNTDMGALEFGDGN